MEELVPKLLTLGEVERVLAQLLRERVSIRDIGMILEALLEVAPVNRSQVALVEAAREALGRRLVQPLLDFEGQLPVLLLDPSLEGEISALIAPESSLHALPQSVSGTPVLRRLIDSVKCLIGSQPSSAQPVLLCSSPARFYVRRWLEPLLPRLAVIAPAEIPLGVRLRPVGTVK